MVGTLAGKTLVVTGATRGIGKAIALRAAQDGANIVVIGKTDTAHPQLPDTVFSTRDELIAAGGQAIAFVGDVRSEEQMQGAVAATLQAFGGIDVLVNNASAISLTGTVDTPMKRFDLMHSVNVRGTFLCSQLCIPHLAKSSNPHILTLSPPPVLRPDWFAPHLAYTLSKYGMSLCTLGLAEELRPMGIAVNSLWPKTLIATSAVKNLLGGTAAIERARVASIMADAAHAILTTENLAATSEFFIDEDVLRARGVTDFSSYSINPDEPLQLDLFVEE